MTKKNVSSGAEKTEKLARKQSVMAEENKELASLAANGEGEKKTPTAKKAKKRTAHKNNNRRKSEKLNKKQQHKLEKKRIAAERKQKKLEKKLAHKQKIEERKAELKQKKAEIKAEKEKRRAAAKRETKEKRAKRIAEERAAKRLARRENRERKAEVKKQKREQRQKEREQKRARKERTRAPGFGGWLAAVISLGVTTLALGTILTFGWMKFGNMQASAVGVYTQSLYELNSVVDDLDTDLAKAVASSSSHDRVKVFSDIAVESENAELILERFPLEIQTTERLTFFINDMSRSARGMLYTVVDGGELNQKQVEKLEYMYRTNAKVKEELNQMVSGVCSDDVLAIMRGEDCGIAQGFAHIQNEIFGDDERVNARKIKAPVYLVGEEEISATRAENTALKTFADYGATAAKCVGEANGIIPLYNVNLTLEDESEMLVQISKAGGKLVAFDSYKDCPADNFSVDLCVDIANEFLLRCGYEGLIPVWASENGTTCNVHFATEADGVIVYSDLVKVKVCEERGIVSGMDASGYLLRHRQREIGTAAITERQAQSAINGNIQVKNVRLAMIPQRGEEILCYEFFGEMNGVEYYIYVDAATGEELEVKTVVGTAQGKLIR